MSRLNTLIQNATGSSHDTTFTFGYNPSSQITSRTRTNSVFDWPLPASFSDSYSANGLNQYTNVDGAIPSYDTRGNLTNDGSKTYGYDYDNRMISASGSPAVTLNYDPAGRLHQVAAGAATTRFLYDGADLIAEYNTSGGVLRRYVHGPDVDEPLLWYEGSGTSDKRYLMADERGSVIGVTNTSGSVTTVNKYDANGVPGASNAGRFQYTGQVWLEDVGLYHYKARAYDPELGRFLQTDPIGTAGGINLYAYARNDAINFKDPTGLDDCWLQVTWMETRELVDGISTVTSFEILDMTYIPCPEGGDTNGDGGDRNGDRGNGQTRMSAAVAGGLLAFDPAGLRVGLKFLGPGLTILEDLGVVAFPEIVPRQYVVAGQLVTGSAATVQGYSLFAGAQAARWSAGGWLGIAIGLVGTGTYTVTRGLDQAIDGNLHLFFTPDTWYGERPPTPPPLVPPIRGCCL